MTDQILYKNTKKLPKTFEEEEISKIIQYIVSSSDYWKNENGNFLKWRDICLIATIYLCALRPLEACRLKFSDFDFKTSIVRIHGSKRHKDRIVPVPKLLNCFYKEYFKFSMARYWRGSPYLFPSFQNNHISPGRLKHIFREKALKPTGLWDIQRSSKAEFRTLYKLRHSRASHILAKQIKKDGKPDIYSLCNLLGHADIRSTTVYLHTNKNYIEYLREQMEL